MDEKLKSEILRELKKAVDMKKFMNKRIDNDQLAEETYEMFRSGNADENKQIRTLINEFCETENLSR